MMMFHKEWNIAICISALTAAVMQLRCKNLINLSAVIPETTFLIRVYPRTCMVLGEIGLPIFIRCACTPKRVGRLEWNAV